MVKTAAIALALAAALTGLSGVTAATLAAEIGGTEASQVTAAAAAPAPLPACAGVYQDVATTYAGYADWQRTLVDTIYMVPSTYYPPDLVATGIRGGGAVRGFVRADLLAMAQAATNAGAPIQIQSAFRSYASQIYTFNYWVRVSGLKVALLSSARPGHSEHQLGTTIDFTTYGGSAPWNYADWAATKAGAWMAQNAWKYGFVMSYPKGKSPTVTCYQYEPWHYRYVGRDVAATIHAGTLTLREYLWAQLGAGNSRGDPSALQPLPRVCAGGVWPSLRPGLRPVLSPFCLLPGARTTAGGAG